MLYPLSYEGGLFSLGHVDRAELDVGAGGGPVIGCGEGWCGGSR